MCDGKLWSLNNRRLAVLKMYQGLSQDQTVWATCILRPPSHQKFAHAKTTQNDGLSVKLRDGQDGHVQTAYHLEASAFNLC